jgi:hypothetical protein
MVCGFRYQSVSNEWSGQKDTIVDVINDQPIGLRSSLSLRGHGRCKNIIKISGTSDQQSHEGIDLTLIVMRVEPLMVKGSYLK